MTDPLPEPSLLASRFEAAQIYALHVHGGQTRKNTSIPYISHLLSVVGLVLEQDAANEDLGHYIFPKGHVEANETLEQAAERELEEETGIRTSAGRHVGTVSYTRADDYYEVHLFAMKYAGKAGELATQYSADAVLLPLEEARRHLSFEAYRWALARAFDHSGRDASR